MVLVAERGLSIDTLRERKEACRMKIADPALMVPKAPFTGRGRMQQTERCPSTIFDPVV